MKFLARILLATAFLVGLSGRSAHAQNGTSSTLRDTVARLDTQIFEAYNHCDLQTLGNLVSDDLEFYHDKTGLAVGKAPFLKAIQENICGKVQRTLTAGTLEVYPLEHYGAVEMGAHTFTHPGHAEDGTGEARFVMLWHQTDSGWKLTRVISYNHEPVATK
jgi:ketosteroid isomerase-like protein